MIQDAEASIALLRERAGVGKKKSKREKDGETISEPSDHPCGSIRNYQEQAYQYFRRFGTGMDMCDATIIYIDHLSSKCDRCLPPLPPFNISPTDKLPDFRKKRETSRFSLRKRPQSIVHISPTTP
jgi:hypothetical protein